MKIAKGNNHDSQTENIKIDQKNVHCVFLRQFHLRKNTNHDCEHDFEQKW